MENFFYKLSNLNYFCWEIFWEIFSQNYPNYLHIIQVDNSGYYQLLNLIIPIILFSYFNQVIVRNLT